jgi:hypothetical protein
VKKVIFIMVLLTVSALSTLLEYPVINVSSSTDEPNVMFSFESPYNTAFSISTKITTLSVIMNDPQGDLIEWSIESSPDIGSTSTIGGTNGTKNCTVSGLAHETTYTWYVNATDGYNWTREVYTFTTKDSNDFDFRLFQHSVPSWLLNPFESYFGSVIWVMLFSIVIGVSWGLSKDLIAVLATTLITFACFGASNAFLAAPEYSLFFSVITITAIAGALVTFVISTKGKGGI